MEPDAGCPNAYRAFFDNILSFKRKKGIGLKVPTGKDDIFYNMSHKRRGLAVIFNHIDFDEELKKREGFERRDGTMKDCERLQKTFDLLGFDVNVYSELKVEEITATLEEIRRKDFKNCDCLMMVVLSHGEMDRIFAFDDWYKTDLLIETFTPDKCPSLVGKPKVLVLQLCQGKGIDDGCDVRIQTDGDGKDDMQIDSGQKANMANYRLPLFADFLMACSTTRGYYSYRDREKGSYYIQTLCEELDNHSAEFDILTILTFVNRRVATEFESYYPRDWNFHRKKQMPSFTSMLTRLLAFHPK